MKYGGQYKWYTCFVATKPPSRLNPIYYKNTKLNILIVNSNLIVRFITIFPQLTHKLILWISDSDGVLGFVCWGIVEACNNILEEDICRYSIYK